MISVVIPTYNERENIRPLIEKVDSAFIDCQDNFEIVIIDDDSPDGTADVVRSLSDDLDIRLRVVVRTSQPDLSRSVVRGFREAEGDIVVVMDADHQHPPELIPELADSISSDTPLAVGSRYADGGNIKNWSRLRRVVSYGAIFISKILIPPARKVGDPVSGFFAVQIDAVPMAELSPHGYKILLELLVTIDPENIVEIGFTFESREYGQTSLDFEQYRRFLSHTIKAGIRYRLER